MAAVASGITVQVRFMGDLPAVTGGRNLRVTLPQGATIADLLASLSKTYGDDFRVRIFSGPEKLQHTMLIFMDGENIEERGGLGATLGDSEVELFMLPMIEGG